MSTEEERQAEAVKRLEDRKALTRRRYAVGDLAERAGLFAWDNAVLADLLSHAWPRWWRRPIPWPCSTDYSAPKPRVLKRHS